MARGRGARRIIRGGVLLEVLLSIGIFVTGATFTLAASRNVFHAIARTQRKQLALDLARSALAELEAGLITPADLRGEVGRIGSIDTFGVEESGRLDPTEPLWVYDVQTSRTEFTGLSLVELTVREEYESDFMPADATVISVTLRQLMPLREEEEEAYESDEMLEGLPEANP